MTTGKNPRRSNKRSRSGATSECLHCGKKLRGQKGARMHMINQHPEIMEAKKAGAQ